MSGLHPNINAFKFAPGHLDSFSPALLNGPSHPFQMA